MLLTNNAVSFEQLGPAVLPFYNVKKNIGTSCFLSWMTKSPSKLCVCVCVGGGGEGVEGGGIRNSKVVSLQAKILFLWEENSFLLKMPK